MDGVGRSGTGLILLLNLEMVVGVGVVLVLLVVVRLGRRTRDETRRGDHQRLVVPALLFGSGR